VARGRKGDGVSREAVEKFCIVVLEECLANKEMVAEFDRLHGTNVAQIGTQLDLAIDKATGRLEKDVKAFLDFSMEHVAAPLLGVEWEKEYGGQRGEG
jgi:hypothetical protein